MSLEVKPEELKAKIENKEKFTLLDVRQPEEYTIANIGGVLIPLDQLPMRYIELKKEDDIVVMCHHGIRSAHAVGFLRQKGYEKTRNLTGGIDAYSVKADPSIPRY